MNISISKLFIIALLIAVSSCSQKDGSEVQIPNNPNDVIAATDVNLDQKISDCVLTELAELEGIEATPEELEIEKQIIDADCKKHVSNLLEQEQRIYEAKKQAAEVEAQIAKDKAQISEITDQIIHDAEKSRKD